MLTAQTRVVRSEQALAAEIEGELVMMDARNGAYFNLDPIASAIWKRIAEPVAIDALCIDLTNSYEGDLDTIRKDVLGLFDRMLAKGLIETVA